MFSKFLRSVIAPTVTAPVCPLLYTNGWIVTFSWFHRIIVDLLKMNVAPLAVFQTLKAMCAGQKISDTIAPDPSTVTEARGQSSVSGSALIMLLN